MAIKLMSAGGGSLMLDAESTASNLTLTVPANAGKMITTASGGRELPKAALPAGAVLQTVYTHKTSTFSVACSGNTLYDVTGLAATITPTSTTSLILVQTTIYMGGNQNAYNFRYQLKRNGTAVIVGDAEGGRPVSTGYMNVYDSIAQDGAYQVTNVGGVHMDTPASTSALTYQVAIAGYNGSTVYLNRSATWQNSFANGYDSVPVSSIILMEIAV